MYMLNFCFGFEPHRKPQNVDASSTLDHYRDDLHMHHLRQRIQNKRECKALPNQPPKSNYNYITYWSNITTTHDRIGRSCSNLPQDRNHAQRQT